MTVPAPCTPGGPGVDVLGFCATGDPVFEGILWAFVPIFGFLAAALTGSSWRRRVRIWLYGGTWSHAYIGLMDWLLGWLDRFFGPPLGWKAFDRCVVIAMFYSVLYLAAIVALKDLSFWSVATATVAGAASFAATFMLFRRVRRAHVRDRESASAGRRLFLHACELTAYSFFIVALFLVSGAAVVAGAGVITAAGAGAFAGVITAAGAGAVAGAVAAVAAAAGAGAGAETMAAVFTIILGIPALNAMFDWPSWWASRWLMARLRQDAHGSGLRGRVMSLTLHAAADIALALACLFGLAILFANLMHLISAGSGWQNFSQARDAPFAAESSGMTVMLISTLIPTAIHLFFAVFALATLRPPFATRAAFWMQEDQEGAELGTQMLIALYLTACAGFALLTLWGAGRLALMALDGLVGGAGIWPLIFDAADALVIFN